MFRLVVLLATLMAATSSASIPTQDVIPLDGRIVGGTVTDISKHPHQISMRYKSCETYSFKHRCGGSIISKRIILIAAHCVVGIEAERVHVVAGSNKYNGDGVLAQVEKIVTHEDYSIGITYDNDIAILVLKYDLPLNDYDVKPIKLAENQPKAGVIATVTGWGATSEGGPALVDLLQADVPIVSKAICSEKYGDEMISNKMLCAGYENGGKVSCQGDSGGPLTANGNLVGVVSWGLGCGRPDFPRVYANVANLRTWIDGAVSANS